MKCSRCGRQLGTGVGRYIMTMTFIADVDHQLSLEVQEGDMDALLKEIEQIPEKDLYEQVYQKRAFLLCRPCKENIAARPFGAHSTKKPAEPVQ